jgi:hypothetical protein
MAGVLSVLGAVNVIAGTSALSLANLTALNDGGLPQWWRWTNNISLLLAALAGDLGVAPNTVALAYRELEADGLIRSRGRRGTTVTGLPAAVSLAASH